MLTGDLVRATVQKKVIRPSFIDASAPRLLTRAESIIAIMAEALEGSWTRGRIQAQLRDVEGTDTDHKITKGIAKLLMDKGTFETCSPIDPSELRQAIFARAAVLGPLARQAGPTERRTAETVLAEFADKYDTTVEAVGRALYADLKDEQVLTGCKLPTPEALLQRYNVALVQALLIRASRLNLDLVQTDPKYVRQLVRHLKFHQLMYRSEYRNNTLSIEVDGPQSLLRLSTRYGLQLANFFPAVLLQPGEWRMDAEILWGRKRKFRKSLSLDHTAGLVSHYRDTGTWTSRTESWFVDRFTQLESDWNLGPGEPIDLGDQTMLVPDFTFRKDGRVGHLEIVGFWRKKHLASRLASLPENVIVAVSSKLAGEGGGLTAALEDQVIRFAEVIPPKKVVERLERICR